MKVEKIDIEKLVKDPVNARKHGEKNIEAIKGSLAKFGQQKPIVVNMDNVVVAGNGTLEAARFLGWKEINIVRTKLTGSDVTAFGIADNRTAELADWDDDVLGSILSALKEENYDLDAIGVDEYFIEAHSGDWDSDFEKHDNTKENLDGILATIKITCPQELKDEVLIYLKGKLLETSFEGVHVE